MADSAPSKDDKSKADSKNSGSPTGSKHAPSQSGSKASEKSRSQQPSEKSLSHKPSEKSLKGKSSRKNTQSRSEVEPSGRTVETPMMPEVRPLRGWYNDTKGEICEEKCDNRMGERILTIHDAFTQKQYVANMLKT